MIRKTSLLRIVPTACGQAADIASTRDLAPRRLSSPHGAITLDARRLRSGRDVAVTIATRSDPSSSRCQRSRTRTDSLWAFNTGAEFISLRTSIPAGGARRDRTDDLLLAKQALSQLSYGPGPSAGTHRRTDANKVVGLGRFELPTSRLSSARSNQLSYKPEIIGPQSKVLRTGQCSIHGLTTWRVNLMPMARGSFAKKEKRRRRCPANGVDRFCKRAALMFPRDPIEPREGVSEGSSLERR